MNKKDIKNIFSQKGFCSHLFLSGTLVPGSNWIPCCKSGGHTAHQQNIQNLNYFQYINSSDVQTIAKDLESSTYNEYCNPCKSIEKIGKESNRMSSNRNMLKEIVDNGLEEQFLTRWNNYQQTGKIDQSPWNWHMFLDNTCQARCVMCDSTFSSSIEKEYSRLDLPETFMSKIDKKQLTITPPAVIIEEFKKHADQIKILHMLGGEPTVSKISLDVIKWLVEKGYSKNIFLKINTNGIALSNEWLEITKHFKKTQWSVSVDAVGDLNNWIRYPTNWNKLLQNIQKIIDNKYYYTLIKTTVHALNAHFLPELHNWANDLNLPVSYNIVEWPRDISIATLTKEQRASLIKKYQKDPKFLEEYGNTVLSYIEDNSILDNQNLIKFINIIEKNRPCSFQRVNPFFKTSLLQEVLRADPSICF